MSTISIQCRWKIIEKWLAGLSDCIIANHLGVSKSSVIRIRRRFQQFGTVKDFTSLRGRPRLLTINDMKYLDILLKERVDWYIWELQSELEKWKSQTVGYATIWRALRRLGYSHKQLSKIAKERNQNERANFLARISQYNASQLVFSDESAYDKRTLSRRYGWSISGHRAQKHSFFVRGKRYTIEGALCIDGLLAYGIQEGPMTSQDYQYFVETVLLPKMNAYPGRYSVLLLDSASIHKGQQLRNLCDERGIRLEFLPPYSPDYNPIEQTFFYIKNFLRQNRDWVNLQDPIEALNFNCMLIGSNLARACFQHAGYL